MRVETEAGVGFLNHAQTGSLKVVKTADDDQIEGRTFKITGADFMGNAYEQEFQTDENGEIKVTLRVGEYTVSEVAGEMPNSISCRMTRPWRSWLAKPSPWRCTTSLCRKFPPFLRRGTTPGCPQF